MNLLLSRHAACFAFNRRSDPGAGVVEPASLSPLVARWACPASFTSGVKTAGRARWKATMRC
jgi:hypothetical protein